MTEKETRELIELLRLIAEDSVGYDLLLNRAADALEDTLWKPIADMPDELKDGRDLLLARGRMGIITIDHYDCDSFYDFENPTHYREITAPEQETNQ